MIYLNICMLQTFSHSNINIMLIGLIKFLIDKNGILFLNGRYLNPLALPFEV